MRFEQAMRSSISVSYTLSGFETDPDEITALVGVDPAEVRRQREEPKLKENEWSVDSGLGPEADLPTHITALLSKIEPARQALVELGRLYDAGILCVVKSYGGDRPAIWFDKGVIRMVAELNADLDIDLYVLP